MSKEMRKYIDTFKKRLLKENKMSKLDAFYRLRDMRDTGVVDAD
jgi:hypothetical protein